VLAVQGGAKFQEAALILEEFVDKFGGSPVVFNSLAVVHMQTGEYEDAERNLQDALSKDPKNADALANMICVAHHLSRGDDVISRYMNQLRAADAAHPLLTSLATLENAFQRVSATMGH
jgi:coatomer protein complex subunit epsilon